MAAKDKHPAPAANATAAADNETKVKTPKERMATVGVARVNSVLDGLRILENCADRASYEYNAEQKAKIFNAIKAKVVEVEKTFDDALAGKSKQVVKTGFDL